jgi:putative lipoic acid-binding regulatory protein
VTEAEDKSPLQFPTDYPIKVVGRQHPQLRLRIDAIVQRHVPDLNPDIARERPSGNGNFIAISYTIVARSREQVIALVEELAAAEGVLMVI